MELHLNLAPGGDRLGQLVREIRKAIQAGRLRPGDRLPPTRLLASQLGLARKTVTTAYERLLAEGWLVARTGDGTYVSKLLSEADTEAPSGVPLPSPAARWLAVDTPFLAASGGQPRYAFQPGQTDNARFPQQAWSRCIRAALVDERMPAQFPPDPAGEPTLRDAIARHIAYTRGIATHADAVLVTAGAQQGLDLTVRLLVEPGTVVAIEDPGYPMARALLQASGATVVPVPVDEEGLRVDALPDDASLVYVTPSHQAPLGMSMSLARRQALLHWASQRRAYIVEDDYDSEFRYEGRAVDALQTLDRHGSVIYVGTFSKTMSASLRCGYLLLPPALLPAARSLKHVVDWHTATLTQLALARFIREGHLMRHIRRSQQRHAQRRARLLARLHGDLLPWLEPLPAHVGFHMAARFRVDIDGDTLLSLARRADLGVALLDPFYAERPAQCAGLLLGFGNIDLLDIDPALDRLKAVLQTLTPVPEDARTSRMEAPQR